MLKDTSLQPNTQYFYRAIAVNDAGEAPGDNAAATTTEDPPAFRPVECRQGTRAELEAAGYEILGGPYDNLEACELQLGTAPP